MANEREVNVILNVKTGKADTKIKGVEKNLKSTQSEAQKTGNALSQAFGQVGGPIGNLISRVKSLGTSFKTIAIGGGVAAIGAIGSLFVTATKRGAEFAKALSGLEAVTGASNSEMRQLSNSAKELGSSTQFTSKQVVGLQTEFAKLGFTTKEILNATKSTLDLAASLDVGLGEAASVAGSTLRAFGLETSETQRVVDVMAASTSSTALDFDALRESLKLVAPTSRAMNVSIEETTALLGVLADNGLKGSIAGTGLSKTFIELNKKGIPLNEALKQVANSSDQLNTAIDLVGVVGSKSLLTLANNAPKIDVLTESFENSAGAAKELAETRLDNLAGDTTKLQSAWEGFLLSIEDGSGIFNTIARGIVQATTAFLNFLTPVEKISDELKTQRTELLKTETQIDSLDKIINDATTSENDLKTAQNERTKIIKELKKQYPKYLKDIDAEKTSTEDLKKAINQVSEALINKILIQEKEEEINEQAEDAAKAFNKQMEAQDELLEKTTKIREKFAEHNIKFADTSPAGVIAELTRLQEQERDAINDATKERQLYTYFNNDAMKSIQSLTTLQKILEDAETEYNEELNKTNDLTSEKTALMDRLGIKLDEETNKTNENNNASEDAIVIETDLIKLLEKELQTVKDRVATSEFEIAQRNDEERAIQKKIDALRKLTLIESDLDKFAKMELPKMETRNQQQIDTTQMHADVLLNMEQRNNLRMQNEVDKNNKYIADSNQKRLDQELEGEEIMQSLKLQAVSQTFNSIASLAEAFAGQSERQQKRAFNIQKAANIASALVATYNSANRAFQSQLIPGDPTSLVRAKVAAGIAVASGLTNVALISAQKFNVPSKTTPSEGGGDVGDGGTGQTQAPNFNVVGQSGFNQVAQALTQQGPIEAFVVAGAVTTAQQLQNNTIQQATF